MKVRLKQAHNIANCRQIQFQFHEGPIKTNQYEDIKRLKAEFQFHEGPIKTTLFTSLRLVNFSFNSMKVRLKRFLELLLCSPSLFQFHEGPIKTHCIFQ